MSTRRAITGSVILLVTLLFLGLVPTPAHATTDLERDLLRLTNASRERHDVGRLRLNPDMTRKAHKHSADMEESSELFHTSDPQDYYLRGVSWSKWGENVGWTEGDLEGLQDAFMDSRVHRRNILDPRFHKVAVGVVQRDGTTWVTLFFYG